MSASSQSASAHEPLVAVVAIAPIDPRRPTAAFVPNLRSRADSASPLALWHLLSLDAPTVAALWVVFIARAANIPLPWTAPAAMFLAVWILYAADRLLDARTSRRSVNPKAPSTLEARHHFHAAHRGAFLFGIVVAMPALAVLVHEIPPGALRLYLLLGALLLAWLLLIHIPLATARLPKELAVGIFFPAAIFIPTVARAPWLRPVLFPEAILFAAVCSLNCLYIFAWEHPATGNLAAGPEAHWTTRWAMCRLRTLTRVAIVAGLLLAASSLLKPHAASSHLAAVPAIACTVSAALLLQLDRSRERISQVHLRAAADLCLLTPALLLPLLPVLR